MEMFEGASEEGKRRQQDSERKEADRLYILMTLVAAVSPVPAGAQSSEGKLGRS